MTAVVRRFLVLLAVMFWHGGFTFYAGVVVHVGSRVLGSHMEQGLVTRSVSNYLNLAGLVALVVWGADIALTRDAGRFRRWLRWALWSILLVTLGLLVSLHARLDGLIDLDSSRILHRPRFRDLHAWYLHVSTLQWGSSLVLIGMTLLAWRAEDRRESLGEIASTSQ